MSKPLDPWWHRAYATMNGNATPLEKCPACKRLTGVQAADGAFLLHHVDGEVCKGSGKRVIRA